MELEVCLTLDNFSSTYEILSLLVPNNSSAWRERNGIWFAFFYILMSIYWLMFLGLTLVCVFLLIKRHLGQRFRVKTFIAVDLALIILGVSRVLFILLDPWNQQGFCNHLACVIISRLLGALAFPSLTASYTLVFITLWISARINLGTTWIQQLKILVPLCFVHYIVAIFFEILAALPIRQPMVIIIILICCEVFFSCWGFIVCLTFSIAGFRLLKTVKRNATRSSMVCRDTPNVNRQDLIVISNFKKRGRDGRSRSTIFRGQQKKSIRKVTLITYFTVFLGLIYSILSLFNLTIILISMFAGCFGMLRNQQQYPELWLVIHCIFFTLEIAMSVLLTYAICDYTPLIDFLKKCMKIFCKCKRGNLCFSTAVEEINNSSSNTTTIVAAVDSFSGQSPGPKESPVSEGSSLNNSKVSNSPSPQVVSSSVTNGVTPS